MLGTAWMNFDQPCLNMNTFGVVDFLDITSVMTSFIPISAMLENIAASLLTKYLGDYVEGLDANNLKLNLTAGDVVLTDLKLKKSAMDSLELPVYIKTGYLSKLTLQIPWSSLGSKAAIIKIDGVYLIAGPKTRQTSTSEEEVERKAKMKAQRLQMAELLGLDKSADQAEKEKEKKKGDGFFSRMAMKVIDNVQIFLDKIHIRYEDDVSNPESPFVFGITLDSLHAQSCNADWAPAFLSVGEDIVHKLVTLKNLSIYWNTTAQGNAKFVECLTAGEVAATMQSLVPGASPDSSLLNHHYILRPISGILKATLDRGPLDTTRPRLKLDGEVDEIGLALTSAQFQRLLDFLEHYSMYVRSIDNMELRPPAGIRPTQDPKVWWKFALDATLKKIREEKKVWTWDYIQARSKDRTRYIELHEKKLTVSTAKMKDGELKELEEMEKKLDYADIITFRQLAHASLLRKQQAEKKKSESSGGWFSGWFGGGGSTNSKEVQDETQVAKEKEQAWKEIYAAIGYNADDKVVETVYPLDYVKTEVNFRMRKSAIELRQDDLIDHQTKTNPSKALQLPAVFLQFVQENFTVSLRMREGSMSVLADLKTIHMSDFHTLNSKQLLMLKPDFNNKRFEQPQQLESSSTQEIMKTPAEIAQKIMSVVFDLKPLDAPTLDVRLGMSIQPVQCVLSRGLIDRIIQFFERKTSRAELVEIQDAASSSWESIRTRAEQNLKYALEKKQKIKIDVLLAAPRFTIPRNFTDPNCSAIVLDLGTVNLKSDPDAHKQDAKPSLSSSTIVEDDMYDRFDISMVGLHALVVGGSGAPWHNLNIHDASKYSLIDKFDLSLVLQACKTPSVELPKVKISAALEKLRLDVTDYRISWIMDVLDAIGTSTLPPKKLSEVEKQFIQMRLLEQKKKEERMKRISQAKDQRQSTSSSANLMTPSKLSITSSLLSTPLLGGVNQPSKTKSKRGIAVIIDRDQSSGETAASPSLDTSKSSSSKEFSTPQQQTPSASEPSSPSPLKPQQQPGTQDTFDEQDQSSLTPSQLLKLDFKVGEICLILHKSVTTLRDQKENEIPPSSPLVTLSLASLSVGMLQTSHALQVALKLGSFIVADNLTPGALPIIESGLAVKTQQQDGPASDLVELRYLGIPKASPIFENVEHSIEANFGTLKINVNRVSIACLLQVGNDFAHDMKAKKSSAKVEVLPENQPEEKSTPSSSTGPDIPKASETSSSQPKQQNQESSSTEESSLDSRKSSIISLAKISVNLGALVLCLQKEGAPFIQFDVAKSHVDVDIRDDGVLKVGGYVGGIGLLNCNPGVKWSKMISISGDKILNFQYILYNRQSLGFPGHDMELIANISTVKVVAVNSVITELIAYFGAFDKMRKVIEVTTSYYYNASLDAVRNAAKSATKIKLDLQINNPTIVVPRSSKDDLHAILDLGSIKLMNEWENLSSDSIVSPNLEVETFKASVVGLNLKALTNVSATEYVSNLPLIKESSVSATFKRPLMGNENNEIPSVDLDVDIADIDLSLTEDMITLAFDIMNENLNEKPAREDRIELKQIMDFLKNFTYSMEGWEVMVHKKDPQDEDKDQLNQKNQKYLNLAVGATLKKVSLTVFKESGQQPQNLQPFWIATFSISDLSCSYDAFSDSSMQLTLAFGSVVLEDRRMYSENRFRRIWTSNILPSGEIGMVPQRLLTGGSSNAFANNNNNHDQVSIDGQQRISKLASRLAQQRSSSLRNHTPQFKLNYSMDPTTLETNINISLYRPRLYLIPNTLQELYEFAMSNVERMVLSLAKFSKNRQLMQAEALDKSSDTKESESDLSTSESGYLAHSTDSSTTSGLEPQSKSKSASTTKSLTTDSEEEEVKISRMMIDIILTSPEICVVENSAKIDPLALILQLGHENTFRMVMFGDGTQKMDLRMQDMDAYKCILDAEHSDAPRDIVKLLNPTTFGFHLANNPGQERRMAIEAGFLQCIVSYNDIKLVLDIYSSYTPLLESLTKPRKPLTTSEQDAQNTQHRVEAIQSMESNVKAITDTTSTSSSRSSSIDKQSSGNALSLKDESEDWNVVDDQAEALFRMDKSKSTQVIIMGVDKIEISLLNDRDDPEFATPVLELSIDTTKIMMNMYESGGIDSLLTISSLELNAYNEKLAAFEPVIEPWAFEVQFLKDPNAMGLNMVAFEMLDLNITKSLLDTTFSLLKWLDDFGLSGEKKSDEDSSDSASTVSSSLTGKKHAKSGKRRKRVTFNPYIIRNETGIPVVIGFGDNPTGTSPSSKRKKDEEEHIAVVADDQSQQPQDQAQDKMTFTTVEPGKEVPLHVHIDRYQAAKKKTKWNIDVSFPSSPSQAHGLLIPSSSLSSQPSSSQPHLRTIHKIPISRIATLTYPISSDPPLFLVVDITFDGGSKIVTLRGNYGICNNMEVAMDVEIMVPKYSDWISLPSVPSHEHSYIPLKYDTFTSIRLKPSNTNLSWYEWKINPSTEKEEISSPSSASSPKQKKKKKKKETTQTIKQNTAKTEIIACASQNEDTVWICRASQHVFTLDDSRDKDFELSLNSALTIENATCSQLSYQLVNTEQMDCQVSELQELEKLAKSELYYFKGAAELYKSLKGIALMVKIHGFDWSEPTKFAEHARWIPIKGNPSRLNEPLKFTLKDTVASRPLELFGDVKRSGSGSCTLTVYSNYWIINQTGLNLFYKKSGSEKTLEAAGQRPPIPFSDPVSLSNNSDDISQRRTSSLMGNPEQWYDRDEDLETDLLDFGYSENRFYYGATTLSIRVEDSAWSEKTPLGVQNEGRISIKDEKISGRQYEFSLLVKPAPSHFWRTKLVRVLPAYILVNKTSKSLLYKQEHSIHGGRLGFELKQDQQIPFHWLSTEAPDPKKLMVADAAFSDNWSPPFSPDLIGSFQARLSSPMSSIEEESTLDVMIKSLNGTTFIVFGDGTREHSPMVVSYEIQNKSSHSVHLQQKGSNYSFNVGSNATVPFCWDDPQALEPMLQLRMANDPQKYTPLEFSLDVMAKFPEIPRFSSSDGKSILQLEIKAEGTKKVLVIQDYSPKQPLQGSPSSRKTSVDKAPSSSIIELEDSQSSSSLASSTSHTASPSPVPLNQSQSIQVERKLSFAIKVSLKGIGISVIDATPQELLYFTLQTIFAQFEISNVDQTAELKIGMAQIDNQLYLSPIPIALYSVPNPEAPFFHLSMVKDPNVKSVQFFNYFAVQLQTIELSIHETFLLRSLDFVKFITDYLYEQSEAKALRELLNKTDSEIPKIKDEDLESSDMYYFELLHLNPIKVMFTFMTSIDVDVDDTGNDRPSSSSSNARNNDVSASSNGQSDDQKSSLEKLLGFVGIFTDIDRAPIELNALMLQNPFNSKTDLINRIVKHYTLAGLKQAYKVVGSADFLGNPVSLVSNLGTGVKDFFYEPAQGIVKSPQDFGRGLAKGTKSLVLKTTYAVFDTASKLTGTVAKVGAKLTMDDEYQRERALRNQTKAKHVGEGLVYGARDFGLGLYKGITGVVLQPIKGGQKEGAIGVLKGIGKGLAGVVLKPVVGAVDLVKQTTEGIKNTTTFLDEKDKAPIRPPRHFGKDKRVNLYDYDKAVGQLILRTLDERRGKKDVYEAHVMIDTQSVFIISATHLFVIERDRMNLTFGMKWKIDWVERISYILAAIVVNSHKDIKEHATASQQGDKKRLASTASERNSDQGNGVYFDIHSLYSQESRQQRILTNDPSIMNAIARYLVSLGIKVKKSQTVPNFKSFESIPPAKNDHHAPKKSPSRQRLLEDRQHDEGHQREHLSSPQPGSSPSQLASYQEFRISSSQRDPQQHLSSSSPPFNNDFELKIPSRPRSTYGGLEDWNESENEEQDTFKTKKRRKAKKASETTKLLTGDDSGKGGCCSCCTIL